MENQLELRELTKLYGNLLAVDHACLTFTNGIYGLLGQNGAGKSTLIKMIAGILDQTSGEIFYNEENRIQHPKQYRSILGYMPQQQILDDSYTVYHFMEYMAILKQIPKRKQKIQDLLHTLNLWDKRNQKVMALSGGMKQRVLIGQALLNSPKIVLLDEPTAGLDPIERRNLRQLIAEIGKERIVIIATHVISDIEFIANQIILMKNGRILKCADQKTLLQGTKVYVTQQDILKLQQDDPTLKIVNSTFIDQQQQIRFVSKQKYDHEVFSTMDDVYLDWLG